ncbi:MAG: WD40 repeat domain-containing serine/threonine protein kinase [Oscillochloridaceae bacterium umkhey_bin13]
MSAHLKGFIGPYQMIEPLGTGGMAEVYRAHDPRLDRDVAVKLIRPALLGHDSQALERFMREARTLARLNHPHIVAVFDYGEHEGRPYLVLDYVAGGTLKALPRPLDVQTAAGLLAPIAHALAYAHGEGVIHRDVKPANILLRANQRPLLSDFGIAQLIAGDGQPNLTGVGMAVGTPQYMAPEQWHGKAVPASDCYALGVVFYELVTGQLPFNGATAAAVLRQQASGPPPTPRTLGVDLPAAAEQAIMRALAYDPATRFPLASYAMALEALAAGAEPVLPSNSAAPSFTAYPPRPEVATPPERRRPWWFWSLGLVAVLIALASGMLFSGMRFNSLSEPGDPLSSADEGSTASTGNLPASAPNDESGPDGRAMISPDNVARLERIEVLSQRYNLLAWSPDSRRIAVRDSERGLSLLDAQSFSPQQSFAPGGGWYPTFAPDWSFMALANTAEIALWDVASGSLHATLTGHEKQVLSLAFSADSRLLASGGRDNTVMIWELPSGVLRHRLRGHSAEVDSVAFLPDGSSLVSASENGTVRFWDVASGAELQQRSGAQEPGLPLGFMDHLAVSPDGTAVFAAQRRNQGGAILWRWDLHGGPTQALPFPDTNEIACVALSPDGRLLAVCPNATTVRFFDAMSGQEWGLLTLGSPHQRFESKHLVFAPDGATLSITSAGRSQLWAVTRPPPSELAVITVANTDQIVLLDALGPGWQPLDLRQQVVRSDIVGAALINGGRGMAFTHSTLLSYEPWITLYDIEQREAIQITPPTQEAFVGAPLSTNAGAWFATMQQINQGAGTAPEHLVSIWDASAADRGPVRLPRDDNGGWTSLAVSADGTLIAGERWHAVQIWERERGEVLHELQSPGASLAFSPDGTILAAGDATTIKLWDTATGQLIRTLDGPGLRLTFMADGSLLASASEGAQQEWSCYLWNVADGTLRQQQKLPYQPYRLTSGPLAISADGSLLVENHEDQLGLWDLSNGRLLSSIGIRARFLAFTPDGRQLIAVGEDDVIRRWGVPQP